MQVFLNLTKNAERALSSKHEDCRVRIAAILEPQRVLVSITDNGEGVKHPELLFKPFQERAKATGLGLYLSRALMRSFGGDLRYEACEQGARFTVEIASTLDEGDDMYGRQN